MSARPHWNRAADPPSQLGWHIGVVLATRVVADTTQPFETPVFCSGTALATLGAAMASCRFTLRSSMRTCAFGLLVAVGSLGCQYHEPIPAFRSSVFLAERGISVPLPPPSLTDAPVQEVDVEGKISPARMFRAGTVVFLHDVRGTAKHIVELTNDDSFSFQHVRIDLSDNCLEMWVHEAWPDGSTSEYARYEAIIASDDQSVRVEAGCE